ncbi:MAG: ribosome biogenesis/translation initiation ATPase RLI [Candidatus Woesearchaeota archaeon]
MSRIAVVNNDKLKDMKEKVFIQSKCPINRSEKECIYLDGDKLMIDESLCIGCGICSNLAPEAISIVNLPEELDNSIIHQYGRNGFHLYSMPTPVFGSVIGVVGRNGIGKSTAMKVLAGMLKPNFGNDESEDAPGSLMEFFKGTESQMFFNRLEKGDIKVSYKPQKVEDIARAYNGTVKDLLMNVDEKDSLKDVSQKLSLDKILDTDISKISGGELQRVAIAATVLKKANLYLFDEPTSYLDIKQRVIVSKFIRSLASSDTSVLVIEHDLIILDYMADMIHIMYGQEGTYGITSNLHTTKSGINTYLSGYIKDSNMRFRDKPIEFVEKAPVEFQKTFEVTSWNGLKKRLGRFVLEAPQGSLYRKQIVGMLGENGIGKTSFVRILAGQDRPDEGEVGDTLSVSYKPQYIEAPNVPVAVHLDKALKKHSNTLLKPLGVNHMLDKNVDELSGGELQRVAIVKALSEDADVYLLDEPSAYLDVEQRLLVSKIIRFRMEDSGKSCLVVDHDLLFIDYISNGLIVADGEPAVRGLVNGPFDMEEGMNMFLKDFNLTFRRDEESHRPRANKPDSQMDRKQKSENKLYYS